MAFGAPDWYIRTQTDIIAQTIANLNVDIIAQTLANLNVDIIAQTLANLKVDINAQTLASLAIDIAAQTLANLKVDINAQTLAAVAVDISTQTLANLNIDINAQTIGNLAIDIAAQTLGTVKVRPFFTETKWENRSTHLVAGETDTIWTIPGAGIIHGGVFWCDATDYHDSSIWYIDIDTVTICQFRLNNLQDYAVYSPCGFPVYILKDNPTENLIRIGIQPGLTFEESCVFRAHNDLGEAPDDFGVLVWYSLVP